MTLPDFQAVMLPVLRLLGDERDHTSQEMLDVVARQFALTDADLAHRLPSGTQTTVSNRVAWARSHMKAAGLLQAPRRGVYRITARGKEALASNPNSIGMPFLMQYPEYVEFRRPRSVGPDETAGATPTNDNRTPDDLLNEGARQLKAALVLELREQIAAMVPAAFERLVVELLLAMGYGGPQDDSGLVVGRGGDEGIDGVIKQDRLGLETIYVQAKRWQNVVGRPEIQRFAGALQGQRARKGVFITNSNFTREAHQYAGSIQTTIVLVDGDQLAELMIDHGIGVTSVKTYEVKRVDSDYFAQ